ncbi:MAG TPA: hypothetical protein VFM25_11545 [Verrucomicrobiae bacterium]|nr:hypothetical protein [Verrucomicrobiae bacterium]
MLSDKTTGAKTGGIPIARLARILLLPLLAFIAFNQVLSPQYMIWLVPVAALTSFEGIHGPALMVAIATMLTPIIYPSLHGDYNSGLDLFETIVLLLRDLILIAAWAWLFQETLRKIRFGNKSQTSRCSSASNALASSPYCGNEL